LVQEVHAVLLTGGSAFGLAAAAGVIRWCEERGIGVAFGGARIPIVVGAVVFDLGLGRADVRPDLNAGYAAGTAAKAGRIEQGNAGAGTGATVAKALGIENAFKGGIGTSSEQIGDLIVGAIVAVNAVGEIVEDGRVIAGPRRPDGSFADSVRALAERSLPPAPSNTTIAVIATNARLSKEHACRLASVAHTGLARAIRPIHTMGDGDTIFTLATGQLGGEDARAFRALEALAPLAAERAVIKGVRAAKSLGGVPAVADWEQGHPTTPRKVDSHS
jgi:L-aminopeptidase/D-esterase-like protein